jgi:hypothetical protein
MGCTLKPLAMKPPLPYAFYSTPRKATEIKRVEINL